MTAISPAVNLVPQGVRYARAAGLAVSVALIILGVSNLISGGNTALAVFFILFGVIGAIRWEKFKADRIFYSGFAVLSVITVLLVFVLMFHFLFYTYDMAELGRKPRIPGLQGTIIFLALMQPPAMLFARKPNLLD